MRFDDTLIFVGIFYNIISVKTGIYSISQNLVVELKYFYTIKYNSGEVLEWLNRAPC